MDSINLSGTIQLMNLAGSESFGNARPTALAILLLANLQWHSVHIEYNHTW
jgi:hypothetical protein